MVTTGRPPGDSHVPAASVEQFKDDQRETWSLGDYPQIARDLLEPLAHRLVALCGIHQGQHVLDVAAGSGNLALRAAAAGAHVIASDLTPAMFEAGQTDAVRRRIALDWVEADVEDLPFDPGMFDTVVSCVGAMWAPRHQQTADEMVRVCRPGGTIGLVSWTAEGTAGRFLEVFEPYLPEPGLGVQSPLLWGDPDHVRDLFGNRVYWRVMTREVLRVDRFEGPREFCAYYKANFGPTMRAYALVADEPERTTALDRDLLEFAGSHARHDIEDETHYEYEYLLSVGEVDGA